MNRTAPRLLQWPQVALGGLLALALPLQPAGIDSAALKKLFARPTREYSTGPLWVWNDLLTPKQIRDTLRDLASQQVKQVWVHPRPGLMTPYLGGDWFRLWKVALREAERLDMNVWIYDENSYPSGFAGGWVPELMPEARGRGLLLRETRTPPKWEDQTLAVFHLDGSGAAEVSARARAGESFPEGRYLAASIQRAGNSPWHGNRCYVDLLYPGVTEKFLEVTLEPYRRRFGRHFGRRIPGSFTDEPQIMPAGGLPWTADLPRQFQKRWGYDLIPHLPSLAGSGRPLRGVGAALVRRRRQGGGQRQDRRLDQLPTLGDRCDEGAQARRKRDRARRDRHPQEHARTASRQPRLGQRLAGHVPARPQPRPASRGGLLHSRLWSVCAVRAETGDRLAPGDGVHPTVAKGRTAYPA